MSDDFEINEDGAVVLRDGRGNVTGFCSIRVARYLRDAPSRPARSIAESFFVPLCAAPVVTPEPMNARLAAQIPRPWAPSAVRDYRRRLRTDAVHREARRVYREGEAERRLRLRSCRESAGKHGRRWTKRLRRLWRTRDLQAERRMEREEEAALGRTG